MAYSPTYTFVAGTKARASEVNQNFSDINSAGFAQLAVIETFTAKKTFNATTDADIRLVPGGEPSTNLAAGDLYVNSVDNKLYIYDGAVWQTVGEEGDITGVTAGTGLNGGGTSGTVTLNLTVPVVEANGGTNQTTYATGDILYASAANTLSKLTVGVDGKVLIVAGGVPTWGDAPGDITGVTAGTNLNGGGTSGTVTLNLDNEIELVGTATSGNVFKARRDLGSGSTDGPVAVIHQDNTGDDQAALELIQDAPGIPSLKVNEDIVPASNGAAAVGTSTLGMEYFFLKDTANSDVYRIEIVSGVLQATKI